MRILLTENAGGVAEHVDRELWAAGYDVVRCQRPGDPDDVCVFFRGRGPCPLTLAPVDLAVDVRAAGAGPATVRELGALCAARRSVPLLVAGPADTSVPPWSQAAARCEPEEVVEACADVLAPADVAVGHAVARAARLALRADGVAAEPLVTVAHAAGDTGVFVAVPAGLPAEVAADVVASVRRAAAGWKGFPEDVEIVVENG